MNRISVFYEHILEAAAGTGASAKECLRAARSFGIEGLECDLWRLNAEAKQLFERCGMSVVSVYNMFDFPHAPRSESLRRIQESLETAAAFGAGNFLAIPGFAAEGEDMDEVRESICGLLEVMCGRAAEYGISVTLEDFDDRAAPYSTISGLEFFMKNVRGLGLTFDTGNFAYSEESAEEAYSALHTFIRHVHLKDRSLDASRKNSENTNAKQTLSGRVMYPCEVGGGFIGIGELLGLLRADGYGGWLSIEHFGAASQLGYMKKSAEFIRSNM